MAKKMIKKMAKPIAKKTIQTKKSTKKIVLTKKTPAKKPVVKAKLKVVAKKPAVKVAAKKSPMKIVAKTAAKAPVAIKTVANKAPMKAAPVVAKPLVKQAVKGFSRTNHHHKDTPKVYAALTPKEQKNLYKVGNYVVYPTHGVGKILAEETQQIGEIELRLLVINFEKDKMTLRVPMQRATAAGLRPISNNEKMKEVYVTLKSKAKTSRGMWSRRAQEYESKINSGNIILISEVVRDLHQNVDQSERSYSERMIYENALGRLVGEVAAAEGIDGKTAHDKLMKLLRAKVAAAAALKEAA